MRMNSIERKLVETDIAVIMMRVDQLVVNGATLDEAKEEALRKFIFTPLMAPFKKVITNAVNSAHLGDLSPKARKVVDDSIYESWLEVNKRKDSAWSRFRFQVWLWFCF